MTEHERYLEAEVARLTKEKSKIQKCLCACIAVIRTQRDELKYQLQNTARL